STSLSRSVERLAFADFRSSARRDVLTLPELRRPRGPLPVERPERPLFQPRHFRSPAALARRLPAGRLLSRGWGRPIAAAPPIRAGRIGRPTQTTRGRAFAAGRWGEWSGSQNPRRTL